MSEVVLNEYFSLGLRWLSGEDLVHSQWQIICHLTRTFSRDFWHGCELWEHHDCSWELWQDDPSVVPEDLCTSCCPPWAHRVHYLVAGMGLFECLYILKTEIISLWLPMGVVKSECVNIHGKTKSNHRINLLKTSQFLVSLEFLSIQLKIINWRNSFSLKDHCL